MNSLISVGFNVETSGADFALVRLAPPNHAPVANAGGPYVIDSLTHLVLFGGLSYDPDADGSLWRRG